VTVRRSPERILLIVQDNGVGFIAPPPGGARPAGGGLGLTGITERVTLLGGRADIRSAPGQGTTVTITFDPRYD
jgi:signal transduction histidine kinase